MTRDPAAGWAGRARPSRPARRRRRRRTSLRAGSRSCGRGRDGADSGRLRRVRGGPGVGRVRCCAVRVRCSAACGASALLRAWAADSPARPLLGARDGPGDGRPGRPPSPLLCTLLPTCSRGQTLSGPQPRPGDTAAGHHPAPRGVEPGQAVEPGQSGCSS